MSTNFLIGLFIGMVLGRIVIHFIRRRKDQEFYRTIMKLHDQSSDQKHRDYLLRTLK